MLTAGPAWTATADSPQTPAPLLGGAEEVLVLTHRCDLAFVEELLRPARAAGAAVTVVYDATSGPVTPGDGEAPIRDLLPVPVVCRSGGQFRARVVICASRTAAQVSIGSGDATAEGWGRDAEVWTHLRAEGPTVPTLITDLAEWLLRLPAQLWIEPADAERLAAVAKLLTARPHAAEADEPLLLTNDQVPIVEQLPFPSGADRLSLCAPAFDPAGQTLAEIVRDVRPASTRLLLPAGVRCDPVGLLVALDDAPQSTVRMPVSPRYVHAGALEWWTGDAGVVVTGGLDCTPESLQSTSAEPGGHCELGLLQEVTASLLDAVDAREVALDDDALAAEPPAEPAPAVARVLGVRLLAERVEAILFAPGATTPDGLVVSAGETAVKLPWATADGRLHTYTAEATALAGRTAQVRAADGTDLGAVPVTDVAGAVTRFTHASPLETLPLAALIGDAALLDALFAAVAQLASGRTPRYGTAPEERRASEETRLRGLVGPALLDLAFGRVPVPAGATGHEDSLATVVAGLDTGQRDRLRQHVLRLGGAAAGWPL
ncbi:hypothetical protein AB0M46_49225, partial [Dactylosporangium sp. NPDC051485]|uniref:hypothetical protein n=1 Tax=Dactylosporangium sp. NPDC051485 TaxID=3154846 RepID=UPI003414554B